MRARHRSASWVLLFALAACGGDDEENAGPDPDPDPDPGDGDTRALTLELVTDGLTNPVALAEPPDGTGRLFVVDQAGLVRVVNRDGTLQDAPFLDVRDRMVELMPEYDERGLLGLAFHPQFATNGRLFIYYTAPPRVMGYDNTSTIAEYRVAPGDNVPQAVGVLLEVDQPQSNHEGGTVAFGPDGYLYVSIGDGGGRDDEGDGPPQNTPVFGHVPDWYDANPGGNGQDIEANLLGDILRLDVSTPGMYTVPADNPFVGRGRGEIYAYGFRNPYRFSFDIGHTDALLVGDAGQEMWEEINLVVKGGNYGWNVKEGRHCFDAQQPMMIPASCPSVDPVTGERLRDPVIEMYNAANPMRGDQVGLVVIIGGHIYRGNSLPRLEGRYIFGAATTQALELGPRGAVFSAQVGAGDAMWTVEQLELGPRDGFLDEFVLGFGQDLSGEVYVLTSADLGPAGTTGRVYRIARR